ncbi:hypothetical protein BRADI_1g36017v3 [Brachypodium distachyon]|uniref:Alpha-L-arabinofuranosidase B arabinose-binding domain-containing protein n=1 Tax=Brachypodium distachyon TaxID=15368 RepID=A0A0Q3JJ61_BRADI|nr:hypothetical protein BRADI_1g36017v3 [Brachypodium distachyon]
MAGPRNLPRAPSQDRLFNNTQGRHNDGLPHLNPTEEETWMNLLPRKLGPMAEFDWLALYRSLTRGDNTGGHQVTAEFLSQVSLHDVRLNPGSMYWQGQQTNLEYLLYLDPDRLVWSFRQQAGIPTIGEHYGGWEAPDSQLRGHFVVHMWASTHNYSLKEKMTRVVDILYQCQKNMGNGYLSAYPEKMFDMYEELSEAWSPYYTIHKIMQGLLDQYTLAGNQKGLEMVVWMTDYFSDRVKNLIQKYSIQRHWEAMNEETGGTSTMEHWWTKEVKYADHYERLLINGIMGNQRGTQPGVIIYFLPMGPGRSKSISGAPPSGHPPKMPGGWGGPNDTFWCCYGTGIESFSKLGDTIYFLEEGETPTLYIVQHIPSTFDWTAAGLTVQQQAKPLFSTDPYFEVAISISAKGDAQPAKVMVRIPSWTSTVGAVATLNGQKLNLTSAGDFLTLTKLWGDDILLLQFPINLRTEAIKEYASIQAVLFGPHLLAGLTHGNQTITSSDQSNNGLNPGVWEVDATNAASMDDWVVPVPQSLNSQLVSLTQQSGGQTFVLSVSIINGTLTMSEMPVAGSDACVHTTFRVYGPANLGDGGVLRGQEVIIEPLDRPGMAVTNDLNVNLQPGPDTLFNAVAGLPGSVSLELNTRPGCFLMASDAKAAQVGVGCRMSSGGDTAAFRHAVSFTQAAPLRRYHPLSFAARGTHRNFLLEPLQSLQDEFYTVYFNLVTTDS